MSGKCYEKLSHTCGSSDGLQVFIDDDGKFTGYCFSCSQYVSHPYGEGIASPSPEDRRPEPSAEELAQELATISALPCVSLPDRKLEKWALDYFNVKIGLSQQDGVSPALHYYPYYKDGQLVAYKTRLIDPKRMWFKGDPSGCDLFGWPQALASGGKRLFCCEGEADAVALYTALKEQARGSKWEDLEPAVVSLTRGAAGARKDFAEHISQISKLFKEIVLVFDMDEAGRKATQEVLKLVPTATVATLPCKDANACLIEGRAGALCKAVLFKNSTPSNSRIVAAETLFEAAKQPPVAGLSWPWEGLTKLTKGLRFGEVSYFGAAPKMGKSELVNTLAAHWIKEHGLKCFLAKPEEANNKTIKMVLGKLAKKHFHNPDVYFDEEAYDKAAEIADGKLKLLDIYQHVNFDALKVDIVSAAVDGCKIIVIDPLSNLTGGYNSAEANTQLQDIAQQLAAIAKDHDLHIHVFCHLRNPDQGPMHERGGKVLSSQFAGSRGMARHCQLMFGLEGNRDPELSVEQRNIRKLVLLEDREFGNAGSIPLYWDAGSGMFTELQQ